LLLADEPTMGLDVTIQKQVLDIMVSVIKKMKSSVILATRDLGIVAHYCNKVAVLCSGQLVELSEVKNFFKNAIHPYSKYLLEAAFASHGQQVELDLTGKKNLILEKKNENGCRFAGRCINAMEICWSSKPKEDYINENHYVACHAWKDKKLGN
jgi:oligopeptide/dipeptide ABC transporter ATP-binding protein